MVRFQTQRNTAKKLFYDELNSNDAHGLQFSQYTSPRVNGASKISADALSLEAQLSTKTDLVSAAKENSSHVEGQSSLPAV